MGRVYDNKEADRLLALRFRYKLPTTRARVSLSLSLSVNNERAWWRTRATKERQIEIFCGFLRFFLLLHLPISVFIFWKSWKSVTRINVISFFLFSSFEILN